MLLNFDFSKKKTSKRSMLVQLRRSGKVRKKKKPRRQGLSKEFEKASQRFVGELRKLFLQYSK